MNMAAALRRAIFPVPLGGGGLIFGANPDTIDLGLWWRPAGPGEARPLTMGDGEYVHPRLSLDGRKLVATLVHTRQALVRLPIDGAPSAIDPMTDGYSGDLDPSFDLRTDRMVFSSTRSGHRNLWLARADGSEATPLTMGTAIDERPAFSPDGELVAFASDRSGQRGIWVMSTSGGAPKMLAETIALGMLTWSSDGKRIIFARPEGNRTGLASVSATDGKVEPIPTPASACCVAASPTSNVLAYLQPTLLPPQGPSGASVARLWLKFMDGQGRPLYSDMPEQQFANGFLAWSPDGKRLAAASVPPTGSASIWIVEPGAREPYRKLADLPIAVRPRGLTWTRDGSSVITAHQESLGDIVMFDVSQ